MGSEFGLKSTQNMEITAENAKVMIDLTLKNGG